MANNFRLANYYIVRLTEPLGTTVFSMATPVLSAAQRANAIFIGICQEGSGYSVKESESVRDSVGQKRITTYDLTLEALIMEALTEAQLTAIDGVQGTILLVPKSAKVGATTMIATIADPPAGTTINLASAGVSIPTGYPCILLTSMVCNIEIDEKFGTGKIAPYTFKGVANADDKSALLKRNVLLN